MSKSTTYFLLFFYFLAAHHAEAMFELKPLSSENGLGKRSPKECATKSVTDSFSIVRDLRPAPCACCAGRGSIHESHRVENFDHICPGEFPPPPPLRRCPSGPMKFIQRRDGRWAESYMCIKKKHWGIFHTYKHRCNRDRYFILDRWSNIEAMRELLGYNHPFLSPARTIFQEPLVTK